MHELQRVRARQLRERSLLGERQPGVRGLQRRDLLDGGRADGVPGVRKRQVPEHRRGDGVRNVQDVLGRLLVGRYLQRHHGRGLPDVHKYVICDPCFRSRAERGRPERRREG